MAMAVRKAIQSEEGTRITIIGSGIAGLVAAITCAENGHPARVLEAHERLGGRARASSGPFTANFGPHVSTRGGPTGVGLQSASCSPRWPSPLFVESASFTWAS